MCPQHIKIIKYKAFKIEYLRLMLEKMKTSNKIFIKEV